MKFNPLIIGMILLVLLSCKNEVKQKPLKVNNGPSPSDTSLIVFVSPAYIQKCKYALVIKDSTIYFDTCFANIKKLNNLSKLSYSKTFIKQYPIPKDRKSLIEAVNEINDTLLNLENLDWNYCKIILTSSNHSYATTKVVSVGAVNKTTGFPLLRYIDILDSVTTAAYYRSRK